MDEGLYSPEEFCGSTAYRRNGLQRMAIGQKMIKKISVETAKMKTAAMPIFYGCTGNNTDSTSDSSDTSLPSAAKSGPNPFWLALPTK